MFEKYAKHLQAKLFSFGAGIFLLIAGGSWFIALGVTKRRISQTQLKILALFDTLTELPNRRLFFDRFNMTIQQSVRNKNLIALFYLDLDNFKTINDTRGHNAGDELLIAATRLLSKRLRKSDTIARIGGDEFAIIIGPLKSPEEAKTVAGKILDAFSEPVPLTSGPADVGISIGISLFPSDGNDAEQLLRHADNAMYKAKGRGGNTYRFYDINENG